MVYIDQKFIDMNSLGVTVFSNMSYKVLGFIVILTKLISAKSTVPQEPLVTPLKLQYVAPKAFLNSAGLLAFTQDGSTNPKLYPLALLPEQSPRHLFPIQKLPDQDNTDNPTNKRIELYQHMPVQYLPSPVLSDTHYQQGYILMEVPAVASSYPSVAYYEPIRTQHEKASEKNKESKAEDAHRSTSGSEDGDVDRSSDLPESKNKVFRMSYEDNHVKYSY